MSFSVGIRVEPKLNEEKTERRDRYNKTSHINKTDDTENRSVHAHCALAEHEAAVLPNLLQRWPGVVITSTLSGQITSVNRSAETLFGYSEDELVETDISALFSEDFSLRHVVHALSTADKRDWAPVDCRTQLKGCRKSGEQFPVDMLVSECALDRPPVYIFYVADASARARQEQRIEQLEREVNYLARHSLLGELATTITHELSQPLTAITNYTAAAGRCWPQSPADDVDQSLELIAKAGEQAKRAWLMMHRLRKLLQNRATEYVEGDLRDVLSDAVQLATLGAQQQGISIETDICETPVTVRMDRIQLQILFANLIRNAIDELRVSKGERKMWIRLHVNEKGQAVFSVEDTGPGISPDVHENLFDPFQTTKPEGLGIGLAVSRRIALAHNGRLAADNRAEGGAAFSFYVPICETNV